MDVEEEEEDEVEEEDRSQDREAHFARAWAVDMHMDKSQEPFCVEIYSTGKVPDAYPGASVLREPAQSKCTWTCHKRHFARKFTGKMANANPGASILCEPAQSKCTWTCQKRIEEAFCTEIYRENAGRFRYHLD